MLLWSTRRRRRCVNLVDVLVSLTSRRLVMLGLLASRRWDAPQLQAVFLVTVCGEVVLFNKSSVCFRARRTRSALGRV